jgi:hypothetical protein
MRRFLIFLLLVLLAACNNELNAPGDALDIKVDTLPEAYIGEDYVANVQAVGGQPPYTFKLSKGNLPPGFSLQGGTIRGIANEEGSYTFTITVSDGNISKDFQEYTLAVTTPPPAEITLNTPLTEVQRNVVLRGEIKNARSLQAFRSLLEWDASRFELVPGSLKASNDAFVIFDKLDGGRLNIDVAILGASFTGNRHVFELELHPLSPSTLGITISTEFLGATGQHDYSSFTEGTFPVEEDAEAPAETEGETDPGDNE